MRNIGVNIALGFGNFLQAHLDQSVLAFCRIVPAVAAQIAQEPQGLMLFFGLVRWPLRLIENQRFQTLQAVRPQGRGKQTDHPVKFAVPVVRKRVPYPRRKRVPVDQRARADILEPGARRTEHVPDIAAAVVYPPMNERGQFDKLP